MKNIVLMSLVQLGLLSSLYAQQPIRADPQRMEARIMELSKFGANPEGGVSRPGFSEADIRARAYIIGVMKTQGLDVQVDAAGNILGRRKGKNTNRPFISFGSHIDSVPFGGNYDGNVGVVGALECIELLNEHQIETDHPLEVIVFVSEEDGLFGSKGMTGTLTEKDLDFVGNSGKSVRQGIEDVGGLIESLATAKRSTDEIAAFIELHIEQGAILERGELNIGIVEGIVGIEEWAITITGKANHAGTTPMNLRQDALLSASKLVLAINQAVTGVKGAQVGTVGEFELAPNASNIIPGQVKMSLEMRDIDTEKVLRIFEQIQMVAQQIAANTGTTINFQPAVSIKPAYTESSIQQIIETSSKELGLTYHNMPSGAGHDAQDMALLAPIGMIFVPSKGGISHSPLEYTKPEDMANGASVLLNTILKLDKLDD